MRTPGRHKGESSWALLKHFQFQWDRGKVKLLVCFGEEVSGHQKTLWKAPQLHIGTKLNITAVHTFILLPIYALNPIENITHLAQNKATPTMLLLKEV